MSTPTPRLQLVSLEAPEPPAPDETLARITDPRAREVYRKKVELGIERDTFTMPEGVR